MKRPEFESERFREVLDGRVVVVDDDADAPDVAAHSENLLFWLKFEKIFFILKSILFNQSFIVFLEFF